MSGKKNDVFRDKYRLKNKDQIDIIESYLGDCAHLFAWSDKGFVISQIVGVEQRPNKDKSIPRSNAVRFKVMLNNYPSNEASIVVYVGGLGGYGDPAIAEVPLTDPYGQKFINDKIRAAIFIWSDLRPNSEIEVFNNQQEE